MHIIFQQINVKITCCIEGMPLRCQFLKQFSTVGNKVWKACFWWPVYSNNIFFLIAQTQLNTEKFKFITIVLTQIISNGILN